MFINLRKVVEVQGRWRIILCKRLTEQIGYVIINKDMYIIRAHKREKMLEPRVLRYAFENLKRRFGGIGGFCENQG